MYRFPLAQAKLHLSNLRTVRLGFLSLAFWAVAYCAAAVAQEVPAPDRPGEDWPCFLGPRHTGISGETGLLAKWPAEGPKRLWDHEVGTGYSAPSVRGNRLVIHHRLKDEEISECLRADTGAPLWKHSEPSQFEDLYGYKTGRAVRQC